MASLIAAFGLNPALVAVLLAGAAGFLFVLAFLPENGVKGEMKKRIAAVKDRREALKAAHKIDERKKKKGKIDDTTLRMMRTTVERFRMEELLNNSSLRDTLAQAGYRGQKAPIVYLFLKIVAPFLMAAASLFYFAVIYAGEFEPGRHSIISLIIMIAGYGLPSVILKNITQKRQTKMQKAFPDALDLTVICVESGMSVEQAFHKVADEIAPQSADLGAEIALTTGELSYLGDRSQAYENFARRTGMQQVKALTGALIQSERYGTPVAAALRVLSEESRAERMSVAERKAAALPAKLTVPMIVFFLPVLFIVIIGPAAIQVISG